MKCVLDTNIVSFWLRGVERVGEKLRATPPNELAVSSVTEAELWFGMSKVPSRKREVLATTFLDSVTVITFDRAAARTYGSLRALLERGGTPIGVADTMIAAQALAGGHTLVTNNLKHFNRVPRLRVEDWT